MFCQHFKILTIYSAIFIDRRLMGPKSQKHLITLKLQLFNNFMLQERIAIFNTTVLQCGTTQVK
jgi:hypothetical protein